MDYGDDPYVSTMYGQHNAAAAQALVPGNASALENLRNRHSWCGWTLDKLRNYSITPQMLVTAGVKWPALVKAHGVDALVDYGFRWHDMLSCGFAARHLCSLTRGQRAKLGINARRALECRPGIRDIVFLNLTAVELVDMGWTLQLLKSIGLNATTMVDFGFSLPAWVTHFKVKDFGALGFDTYATCAAAGWSNSDILLALQRPTAALVTTNGGGGALRFV